MTPVHALAPKGNDMRMMWLLPLVFACGKPDETDTADTDADADTDSDSDTDADTDADSDTDADTDTDSDTDADTDSDTDADWDFLDGLTEMTSCQTYTDSDGVVHDDVPGATSYYRGNLGVDGSGNVDGYEYWVLLPNDAWAAASGAADCALVWHVTGVTSTDVGSCGSCDAAMTLSAVLDESITDCPADFVDYQKHDGLDEFDEGYSIDEDGSGALTWYFPSGTRFASGQRTGDVYAYTTAGSCAWF